MDLDPDEIARNEENIFGFKVPFRVLRHFIHKASVTSVNAEANIYRADWLMSVFVSELGSQVPAPCTQSTRSVHAAVPKDCERDFTCISVVNMTNKKVRDRVVSVGNMRDAGWVR